MKLGFGALVALVFGMMVGSGLYNLPQNMASVAGPVGVALGWLVTAAGMLLLVATLKILSDKRPDLDAGIYQYAREGFGNYTGFNAAWGYWLCASFANVAYAVMLNDSFGAFLPPLLTHGWPTLLFGSALIWLMYFIVARGIKTAKVLNNLMALIKIAAIVMIMVLLVLNVRVGTFELNLAEEMSGADGSLWDQVKGTMLITLWCFIGIEGAVMLSARAKRSEDIGKATVVGFLVAWLIYALVTLLCYGVMARGRLAGLEDPSVAYVLRDICGDWAYWFVIVSVIVSLLGGWIAWTIVCAQVPYEAALVRIFPRGFMRLNRHQMPAVGLLVSSVAMQGFLILVMMADDVYMAALQITGMMILPPYLASGLYLWKEPLGWRQRLVGALCALFCLWMIYAGGLRLFALTSVFYLAGIPFYLRTLRQNRPRPFTRSDRLCLALLLLLLIVGLL